MIKFRFKKTNVINGIFKHILLSIFLCFHKNIWVWVSSVIITQQGLTDVLKKRYRKELFSTIIKLIFHFVHRDQCKRCDSQGL